MRMAVRPDRRNATRYRQIRYQKKQNSHFVGSGFAVHTFQHVSNHKSTVSAEVQLFRIQHHGTYSEQIGALFGPVHRRIQPALRCHTGIDVEKCVWKSDN